MGTSGQRRAIAGLIGLLLLLGNVRTVAAGGLILFAGSHGLAGMQLDAAELSPSPGPRASNGAVLRDYVVLPGDTASELAERMGISQAALAELNPGVDLSFLIAGQSLRVHDTGDAFPRLPVDGPLTRLQIWPWPPSQGKTMVLWLQHADADEARVTAGEVVIPDSGAAGSEWFLIPLPAMGAPGSLDLAVHIGDRQVILPIEILDGAFERYDIPASASDPILSQADKVSAEASRLALLFQASSPEGWGARSRFSTPLHADTVRTSPFGTRRSYGSGSSVTYHTGEDFSVAPGTAVLAPAAGTVVLAEELFVRGNAVVIDHGHGVLTGYWHLQELSVAAGDRLAGGEVIGAVGSTGLSTGPHLHWELRIGGVPVDPLQWLGS